MADINEIRSVKIGLASPMDIRSWSHGEVKKPETINYRSLKPERDGLFCERIFGPAKDYECYCGHYKKPRFKGIVCERCGVEVTHSKVRRVRMGHIELAAPVTHIWFFKGVPSRIAYLVDLSSKDVERIVYFASHIILDIDEERKEEDMSQIKEKLEHELEMLESSLVDELKRTDEEADKKIKEIEDRLEKIEDKKEISKLKRKKKKVERERKKKKREATKSIKKEKKRAEEVFKTFNKLKPKQLINDDELYRELVDRYGLYFKGGIGAEAIRELLNQLDLDEEAEKLRETIRNSRGQKRSRAIKRLKVVSSFINSNNKTDWMILEVLPVIPPDLRPMVQLDGGRFASSDLNDLYRRVINRNNRLKKLMDLGAPEIIINNEKRMLQESVDSLFDNSKRRRPVTGSNGRPLKSLSDMLKGKQGRFRQNLLGKRVDYSGRSVIVVGPELKLHQCGLPKVMALELFKPFVMRRLVELGHAQNIKSSKKMIEQQKAVVWDVLEEVIKDKAVLLNRAPTLHRLGIEAFEPKLIEGKAIQIHPLVCPPFNADFDGDQMAVHLPLSEKAQVEARVLMLSTHNVLSPAHGRPLMSPTQDQILGIFWLTGESENKEKEKGAGRAFTSPEEAIYAYEVGDLSIRSPITVRMNDRGIEGKIETTVGRIIFNRSLPEDWPFMNEEITKNQLGSLIERLTVKYGNTKIAEILNNLKELGFKYATKPGITISIGDMSIPENKWDIIKDSEEKADKLDEKYQEGHITDDERHQRVIEIWTKATEKVKNSMTGAFGKFNPLYVMAYSGARGSITQIYQLAGMRGLVSNPKGEIIDHPITSNFREGLTVLEYFSSTHGARKGLADTALRTADSGYLTRRLVDVCQDTIIREKDCGTTSGRLMDVFEEDKETGELTPRRWIVGRVSLRDISHPETGEVIVSANEEISEQVAEKIFDANIKQIYVRSPLGCRTGHGVCQKCYGWGLADRRLVEIGEAVGIIAAQSIGEPGTQLTMRTFHTGGVAGEDITHGLPRVVELFEARSPKGQAIMAEFSGTVEIIDDGKDRKIKVTGSSAKTKGKSKPKTKEYTPSRRARIIVKTGDKVKAGQKLTAGSLNPNEILSIKGMQEVRLYLINEVQEVYKQQGVEIDDKHIEIVVRQMLKRVSIQNPGDSDYLPGQLVESLELEEVNAELKEEGKKPATAKPVLMGITKAALSTDSWLSAASFQETTRVLSDASIKGKSDPLVGLKENVIIGKLIPAGTGSLAYSRYQPKFEEEKEKDILSSLEEDFFKRVPDVQADSKGLSEEVERFLTGSEEE